MQSEDGDDKLFPTFKKYLNMLLFSTVCGMWYALKNISHCYHLQMERSRVSDVE
jgi:hypothetical protein